MSPSTTAAADAQRHASTEEMSPCELCHHLRDLIAERIGDVKGMCADASLILACALRRRGLDARVCTGAYVMDGAELGDGDEEHAHVRCDGLIYDPTREQFDDLPLVSGEDSDEYQGASWGAESPPECPLPSDLAEYFYRCYPSDNCYIRGSFLRICTELGIGDLTVLRPSPSVD